jgi:small conductance mechanosensitive channel
MESLFTSEFWHDLVSTAIHWLITVAPSLLLVILLTGIALKVLDSLVPKLRGAMIRQAQLGGASSNEEIEKRVQTLLSILTTLGKAVLLSLVAVILLAKLGVEVAPIIAGAGIAGLAVGFGAQELVRDVISGFFMLLEDQVRTGDVAVINGTGGLVEAMTLRTIALRDLSGVVHVFQNGKINTLANTTKGWSAAVVDIGVAYKEDTDRVSAVMKEVAEEMRSDEIMGPKFLEPIEILGVDAFGDSAVKIRARIKTHPSQQWGVGREYRRRLKMAFDARGIEIPFPHRTLYWGTATEPAALRSGEPERAGGPAAVAGRG